MRLWVDDDGYPTALAWILYLVGAATYFGLQIYNRWILGGRTGQTWGRRRQNTRLVSAETGRPIGARKAFVRDICHTLDSLSLGVGWLMPLWDRRRQTIADKIMKTVVIDVAYEHSVLAAEAGSFAPVPVQAVGGYRVCVRTGCAGGGTTQAMACPECGSVTQLRG